jgi:excisionase family DNA binding protein
MNTLKTSYNESHCYQFDVRLKNLESDLKEAGLTKEEASRLRVGDFEFRFVPREDKETCQRVKAFIERHEWLGKMPHRPTHRFIATHQGNMAGVIVMATPNSFSHLLGPDNQGLEKLIARGACISWSPKNLGSALVMFSIRWMVKNTEFRFFTAYSDTEARELGTIYQACNFTYLGTTFGARAEYLDPKDSQKGWFSDRLFRKTAQFRNYAKDLGITWREEWGSQKTIHWDQMPEYVQNQLRQAAKDAENLCLRRPVPKKHKYVYILGKAHTETRQLKELFRELNPEKVNLPYPKARSPEKTPAPLPTPQATIPAAVIPEKTKDRPLNFENVECRPIGHKNVSPYLTVKEAAQMLKISQWTLYSLIKNDRTFPSLNIGVKKKFVIKAEGLEKWMEDRSKMLFLKERGLLSGPDLLQVKGALK